MRVGGSELNEHDTGEKTLTKDEKHKRDFIKIQTNKKLQVAMMDPDVYNNKIRGKRKLLIKFNHRMTWYEFNDLLRIKFD